MEDRLWKLAGAAGAEQTSLGRSARNLHSPPPATSARPPRGFLLIITHKHHHIGPDGTVSVCLDHKTAKPKV